MEYPVLIQKPYIDFRKKLQNFLAKSVRPFALQWEMKGKLPEHLLKELGRQNFLGLSLPKNIGGQDKDFWYEVILAEELATCGALGWALSVLVQTNMLAPLIEHLGTKKQKGTILKSALKGNFYLGLAVTESVSGSDLAAIECEAKVVGEDYVVNGEKRYISNGSIAKYLVTSVRTLGKNDIWSLSLLLIPADSKGVTVKKLPTVGFKTGDTAAIIFKGCSVPKDNLLGTQDKGFYYLLKGLQRERLIGAVALNALAVNVLNQTVAFLKGRKRFNEQLSKKQAIRHKIAELYVRVESVRQFGYNVCSDFANNKPVDKEIVMLKILSYETCQEIIRECIHLHGAEAFLENHWLAHAYRDSQAFTLAAGTSEIMKDLLAGMLQM